MTTTTPPGTPAQQAPVFGPSAYAWALALVTGLDYFDSALFSYFASYIAGGINASRDEIVWASSAYAVAAVLGILQQEWWVERLGNRRYIALSMLLYAAAAALSALADTSSELMLTRAAQGYLIGPMMGACRILLQDGGFSPQAGAQGRRWFLMSILVANALAPIAGGLLLAHFDWRALFACTVPLGLALCWFVLMAVPDSGRVERARDNVENAKPNFWPYLAFALSQGALQIFLQQLHFQLFTSSAIMAVLLLSGFAGLAFFAHHQWHHPRPLVRLQSLRERTFVVGLGLYACYYYLTTTFGYLVLRLLEEGLAYPVENAGWFVGTTSLASVAMLFAYYRFSPRVAKKKWFIVPGFGVAALVAVIMARMPPDASQQALVAPLVLRGVLVMFIAIPVANLTFRIFSIDEFSHSYRLKNIVRQLVVSFATSSIIVLERHREALHYTRLAESITPDALASAVDALTRVAIQAGHSAAQAQAMALAQLQRATLQQASFLSIIDGFYFLAVVAVVAGVLALWQREIN